MFYFNMQSVFNFLNILLLYLIAFLNIPLYLISSMLRLSLSFVLLNTFYVNKPKYLKPVDIAFYVWKLCCVLSCIPPNLPTVSLKLRRMIIGLV